MNLRCKWCDQQPKQRYKFHLPVYSRAHRAIQTLSVPEDSMSALNALFEREGPARGLALEIRREGKRPNGAYLYSAAKRAPTDQLPETFEVRAVLYSLWDLHPDDQIRTTKGTQGASEPARLDAILDGIFPLGLFREGDLPKEREA